MLSRSPATQCSGRQDLPFGKLDLEKLPQFSDVEAYFQNLLLRYPALTSNITPDADQLVLENLKPGSLQDAHYAFRLQSDFGFFNLYAELSLVEDLMKLLLPSWNREESSLLSDPLLIGTYLWDELWGKSIAASANIKVESAEKRPSHTTSVYEPILRGEAFLGEKQYFWGIKPEKIDRSFFRIERFFKRSDIWTGLPISMTVSFQRTVFLREAERFEEGSVFILQTAVENSLQVQGDLGPFGTLGGALLIDGSGVFACQSRLKPAKSNHKPKKMAHSLNKAQGEANLNARLRDTMSNLETDVSDHTESEENAESEGPSETPSTEGVEPTEAEEKDRFSSIIGDGLDLGSLRLALEVCLGEISLDLGELSDIRQGSVLQTELDLTSTLAIRLGEKQLGTGELVMIGDAVGIHVTNWPRTGLNER